ncbi:MAG: polysaccharide biosynthesis/export family protein [Ferruginibacter sp.]
MGTKISLFGLIASVMLFASCATQKKIAYFENSHDTTYRKNVGMVEAPYQQGDLVDVVITSRSREASAEYNKTVNADAKSAGYLINTDGNIEIPSLGVVKAAGYTKKQLKENITSLIVSKKVLVDPMVEIRHLNFEVTVLGEVGHPSVISVPNEQITLIKALALAGDLTIYGKRENILLVREENGVRMTRRININSSDFLNSDFYYLKPNDLLYIEPNKERVDLALSQRRQQVIPLVLTGVSLLFLVFDKVIK